MEQNTRIMSRRHFVELLMAAGVATTGTVALGGCSQQGGDAEDDARGRREGTHVGAQDVQGAGRGGAQRSAQVVAHDTPRYSIWVLLVSLA